MNRISFTEEHYSPGKLYPFTLTRNIQGIRIGILTIREKWERIMATHTLDHQDKYGYEYLSVPINLIPSLSFLNDRGFNNDFSVANEHFKLLENPLQLFEYNDWAIRKDFELVTMGRISKPLSTTNHIIDPTNIFIEEGAVVEHCILNASEGPIYIGMNSIIMEGAMIRGPFAACQGAVIKMGAKIYGATTIGPYCAAGGEIKNSVLSGFSNKAHDGYLGDSVIGEWCNLGAGTSNSNIKNTAAKIRIWNNYTGEFEMAGIKCGLIMGDYSRCAINTSFNTGTVAGVCCNIFGDAPPKYIPDFSWGNEKYILQKALQDIDNWKKLKGQSITEHEIQLLTGIYSSKKSSNA